MTGFIMIKRCNPKDHPMSYYSCVKNINIKMKKFMENHISGLFYWDRWKFLFSSDQYC